MSINIETDLKEILIKLDNRLEKIDQRFEKLETKIDDRFNRVEQRFEKIETKINDIQVSVARLEEKTEGLSKRIESQEFVSRGVLIGLIVAILGAAAKLFGFAGNP
ncbi:hypothetical protein STA3757_26810 [Stanieria sp. NIES-3757]|nr:hypothetical protein STA3757_26810 [Stanieria sp. NIES-3757]